jgi:hypothetical protein
VIFAQDLGRLLEYGWREKQVHEIRIELRPPARHQLFRRFIRASRRAIPAAVGHGVERIGDGHDSRSERDG